jgi:hypothetical protein
MMRVLGLGVHKPQPAYYGTFHSAFFRDFSCADVEMIVVNNNMVC